jgi:hypothetical protein
MPLPNLIYQDLKRSGDNFIARYKPPSSGGSFATITITLIQEQSKERVAELLEEESRYWLSLYSVAVFSSAFDLHDDLVELSEVRESSYLLALPGEEGPTYVWSDWQSAMPEALPDEELLRIYDEIPCTTLEQRTKKASKSARNAKLGLLIVFFWAVVGPLALLIAESRSELLGAAVLIYSLYKITRQALELTGRWPQSKRARDEAEREARHKHYAYHCEMNPEGFDRLKFENLDRMAAKENLAEKVRLDG